MGKGKNGRGGRTRTCGLTVPNGARYHLRYTPTLLAPAEYRRSRQSGLSEPHPFIQRIAFPLQL